MQFAINALQVQFLLEWQQIVKLVLLGFIQFHHTILTQKLTFTVRAHHVQLDSTLINLDQFLVNHAKQEVIVI